MFIPDDLSRRSADSEEPLRAVLVGRRRLRRQGFPVRFKRDEMQRYAEPPRR